MKKRSLLDSSGLRATLASFTPSPSVLAEHLAAAPRGAELNKEEQLKEEPRKVALERRAATLIIELLDEVHLSLRDSTPESVREEEDGSLSASAPKKPKRDEEHKQEWTEDVVKLRVDVERLKSLAKDIVFEAAVLASTEKTSWITDVEPITCAIVKRAINSNERLRGIFADSPLLQEVSTLRELCAKEVSMDPKQAFLTMNLPADIISLIESKREALVLQRLLERIEACIPDLKNKLTPATEEEISGFYKRSFVRWTEDLEVLYKWSNGVPNAAIGMSTFFFYAPIAEVEEEFFYNPCFPPLFRRLRWIPIAPIDYDFCYNAVDLNTGMVVQIDNECQAYRLMSEDYIESVRAYVEELEKNKDNLSAMENATPPSWLSGNKLSDEEPYLYQVFASIGIPEDD